MNIIIFIAGILALFVAIGHFLFGIKWYLEPMLHAEIARIPKATMQSVFHYVSVFLVLSAFYLLVIGLGYLSYESNILTVKFIGLNFTLFAIVQIVYAKKNNVNRPLTSMFQWTLFLPIGILCLI
ncbi:MAG: hypothetical protein CVV23_04540 [Ignavibacteriae bacterium HGW-Ignavibacteriae-2]|jgi:hypothetical protein|nr:hypothetical protein [Bacteroidota bacterium]PKL89610.1 MAG: hypothetical protein CVV23_04540 [Ignavibacteriae bacterium HGW-Ignavibacteriae-2]